MTITAPSDGRLVISGSAQFVVADKANVCGPGGSFLGMEPSLRLDGTSFSAPRLSAGLIINGESYPLSVTQARDVTAGVHDVDLVASMATGNCANGGTDPTYRWLSVTAIFVEGPG
jgi:hypothetical protein